MAYTSQFTGEQMDAAFRRVTNMVVGTMVLTPTNNGYGYGYVHDLETGMVDPKLFTAVRGIDMDIRDAVTVSAAYVPGSATLFVEILGNGVNGGMRYEVSYMLVE